MTEGAAATSFSGRDGGLLVDGAVDLADLDFFFFLGLGVGTGGLGITALEVEGCGERAAG